MPLTRSRQAEVGPTIPYPARDDIPKHGAEEVEHNVLTDGDGNLFPEVAVGSKGSCGFTELQSEFIKNAKNQGITNFSIHHNHPDSLTNVLSAGDIRAARNIHHESGGLMNAIFAHQLNGNTFGIHIGGDLQKKPDRVIGQTLSGFITHLAASVASAHKKEKDQWYDEGISKGMERGDLERLTWIAKQHSLGKLFNTKSYAFGPQMTNTMRRFPELYMKFRRMADESIPKAIREAEWVRFRRAAINRIRNEKQNELDSYHNEFGVIPEKDSAAAKAAQGALSVIDGFVDATEPFKDPPTYDGQTFEEWFPGAFDGEPDRGMDAEDSEMFSDIFGSKNFSLIGGW